MPAGNMVFSGMKSSSGGKSVEMSACRGTRTGGKTEHGQRKKLSLSPQKITQISFIHKTDYGSKQSLNNYR